MRPERRPGRWIPAALLAVSLLLLAGCSGLRELGAPEFLDRAREIGQIHTVKDTRLIGVAGDRVYLEEWRQPFCCGSGLTVYWTRVSGLPEETASALKVGSNPWENRATQQESRGGKLPPR